MKVKKVGGELKNKIVKNRIIVTKIDVKKITSYIGKSEKNIYKKVKVYEKMLIEKNV